MGTWKRVALVAVLSGVLACSGGPEMDAGADGGMNSDAGSCPPMMVPAPAAAVCAASTAMCIANATGGSELLACLDADPNPSACRACVEQDYASICTTSGGCAQEYATLQCCITAHCTSADMTCRTRSTSAGGACATESTAYDSCAANSSTCGHLSSACFMQ